MTESSLEQQSRVKLEFALKLLDDSRRDFVETREVYKTEHRKVEEQVVTHVFQFLSPEENRAQVIQKGAKDVIRLVKRFQSDIDWLTNRVAIAELCKKTTIHEKQIFILEQVIDGKNIQLSIPQYELQVALITTICANAYKVASRLIMLRNYRLHTFIKDNLDINAEKIFKTLKDIAKDKTAEELMECLEEITDFAIEELPGIQLLGKWKRFKEKVLKIHEPYRKRGAEDELFDLGDQLKEDEINFNENSKIIQETYSLL